MSKAITKATSIRAKFSRLLSEMEKLSLKQLRRVSCRRLSASSKEKQNLTANSLLSPSEKQIQTSSTSSFSECYSLGDQIGKGAFSTVMVGNHKDLKKECAIKVVSKSALSIHEKKVVKNEANILKTLSHPHIIKFYSFYTENKKYYFVSEYLAGGTLYARLQTKKRYTEYEAIKVFNILFEALGYCHQRNIAHRDLKPENLLLASYQNDVQIKIADFGFAKHVPKSGLKTGCGSLVYIAPEVLERKPYGTRVDMWSAGVILYLLLSGAYPFADLDNQMLEEKIKIAYFDFADEIWENISINAKDLISKLLMVNPVQRLSTDRAIKHSWLKDNHEETSMKDSSTKLTGESFNLSRSTLSTSTLSQNL